MKRIKLHGHDYSEKWLTEISENHYKLEGDMINYSRVGLDVDNNGKKTYTYIDPPGGPMLRVGCSIEDKILESILLTENGYTLILK